MVKTNLLTICHFWIIKGDGVGSDLRKYVQLIAEKSLNEILKIFIIKLIEKNQPRFLLFNYYYL